MHSRLHLHWLSAGLLGALAWWSPAAAAADAAPHPRFALSSRTDADAEHRFSLRVDAIDATRVTSRFHLVEPPSAKGTATCSASDELFRSSFEN